MKKLILILITFLFILSCNKKDDTSRIILNDRIRLTGEIKNGHVQLNWNLPYMQNFEKYTVIRYGRSGDDYLYDQIGFLPRFDETTFTDVDLPFMDTLTYRVYAEGISSSGARVAKSSNVLKIIRDLHPINFKIDDAILWKESHALFLIDMFEHKILKYDYLDDQVVDTLLLDFQPGYIGFGNNGFGYELYIPDENNSIRIYDAATLKTKDIIDAGTSISCVATNNKGYLVCSSSDDYPFRVYSRESGYLIDKSTGPISARIRMAPGTYKAWEIINSANPVEADIFYLDNQGNISSHQNPVQGNMLNIYAFKVSPNGNYLISGFFGSVYGSRLNYIGHCANNRQGFNDFCFNDNSSIIYGASYNEKLIRCYSLSLFTISVNRTIYTNGYPLFIFYLDGNIISVSRIGETGNKIIVEKITTD